jgi:hypothetical protein
VNVIQVKCPACSSPIYSKEKDRLFFCAKCNTMHVRDQSGGVERMDFEVAEFSQTAPQGERVYVPFWRLYSTFVIRSKSIEGGQLFRLAQWVKGNNDTGNMFIYVPATNLDPGSFKSLATQLTANPPRYATRLNFNSLRRMPSVVTRDEAVEMADFIVVTMEAEQPGTLQRLDYTLTVNDAKIVYLPFVLSPTGMYPGF